MQDEKTGSMPKLRFRASIETILKIAKITTIDVEFTAII